MKNNFFHIESHSLYFLLSSLSTRRYVWMCAKESKLMFSKVNNTKSIWRAWKFFARKEAENDRNVYCARHAFIQIIYHLFILSAIFCFVSYIILIFHLVSSLYFFLYTKKTKTHAKVCLIQITQRSPDMIALFSSCSLFC